jgi:hypothetical protein
VQLHASMIVAFMDHSGEVEWPVVTAASTATSNKDAAFIAPP